MTSIKAFVKRCLYFFAKKLNLINRNYYRIDGGLGSQIICYLMYAQAKQNNQDVYCDTSFFKKNSDDKIFLTNTYRKWGLDKFGITLNSLESSSQVVFWDKFKLIPDDEYFGVQFEKFLKYFDYELTCLIPNLGLEKTILNNNNIGIEDYSVIHIRKGDFLKYASFLVHDTSYINLLLSIKDILTDYVFIVSDEKLDSDLESQIKEVLVKHTVIFEYLASEFEVHSLMRNSKILVTSNSMFSLSAAILRSRDSLTITPKIFYSNDFINYNEAISNLSNWSII